MSSPDAQPPIIGRPRDWRALVLPVGILCLLFAIWAADRIVDWLWMGELGYRQVFWRVLGARVALLVVAFVPLVIYFFYNLRALIRSAAGQQAALAQPIVDIIGPLGGLRFFRLGLPVLLASLFALPFAGRWDEVIRFIFGGDFGTVDPVFGNDIGTYVFRLPLLESEIGLILLVSILTLGAQVILHHLMGVFASWQSLDREMQRRVVAILAWNVVIAAIAAGASYLIARFQLLYVSGGTVAGAGFTDVKAVIPALWFMAGVSVALVVVAVLAASRARLSWLVGGVAGLVGIHIVALWIVPGAVQAFVVDPNELAREEPYLEHNIAFTRAAFGIGGVTERDYAADQDLELEELADNRDTIRNIRLWDYRPLLRTYRQIQQIRLYYQFYDVDVDRYQLDDGYRQVMLSARELTPDLPARADTWVNRHLQYTHGYGLAMSLAAQEGGQGSPTLIARDLPPVSTRGVEIGNPAIYYGERMPEYRIVPSDIPEFDHPSGDENVYARYEGDGGVPISSFWSRLLFSFHLFDVNILLTDYITEESRIQIRRPLEERISTIAPFLTLDQDPYLVTANGRLYWIQDAYTTANHYPYSEPYRRTETERMPPMALPQITREVGAAFNYIRNSVKIVVDAYDGDVAFHVMDQEDPLLAAYREAFPDLFRPLSELPTGLKAHLRYPQDLFQAQVARFAAYHMTEPQVFYNNEDLWTVPREKYGGDSITMEPYYILMRLPEEESLQFMLMTPLAPNGRDNMIAWMSARADFPGYGELVAFKLPKERLIFGPLQIEALIDQDTAISRQLSLWDQRGSRVIRGNLLAIPIDHSLIYVEPVYLVAEEGDLPQLKRVIVAYGDRVVMEATLDGAINRLFRMSAPDEVGQPAAEAAPPALVSRIRDRLERAQGSLAEGDWVGFGSAMEDLESLLGSAPVEDGSARGEIPGDGSADTLTGPD